MPGMCRSVHSSRLMIVRRKTRSQRKLLARCPDARTPFAEFNVSRASSWNEAQLPVNPDSTPPPVSRPHRRCHGSAINDGPGSRHDQTTPFLFPSRSAPETRRDSNWHDSCRLLVSSPFFIVALQSTALRCSCCRPSSVSIS